MVVTQVRNTNDAGSKEPERGGAARGKGKRLRMVAAGVLLAAAGGGAAWAGLAWGWLGPAAPATAREPQLLLKGQTDPYPAPAAGPEDGPEGEGGSVYRIRYFRFTDSFTTNLAGSSGLIQVTLAASTRRDGRVLQWLQRHELALRSAILVELAATPAAAADTVSGKADLQRRLTAAINRVLAENEGFGGVDQVHFQGYLVQ
ncbi:flagellar basal body-associated FliL family protein [Erythrobacteraceae bacterium CFH 75059]|uniref:flagellar basal body-associated FliL family protein n=1 Tax=Qipengyuania thermophila TaxID=2509361 RepID=UPI001022563D|nr:flagellar basal body-associated FliL family protein [Qipengyuania thermophila]TCD06304.1 flagellar basal body-associated FliL family protein [Erythrobacteraceae bacterium CFH 75059]